jgi:hypothetical protein
MLSSRNVQTLRQKLLEVAFQAREDGLDNKKKALAESRAQVEEIIDNLQTIYHRDEKLFDPGVFEDIKTAKVCAGLITRLDLERAEDAVQKKATVTAHKLFLKKLRIAYQGTRPCFGKHQNAVCVACQRPLDNEASEECRVCFCPVCPCGACGCVKKKVE